MPKLRFLVFDLDGTLIDSRADLVQSVNAMLADRGRPHLPAEVVAGYVGDGVTALVQRALGVTTEVTTEAGAGGDEPLVASALRFFLEYYNAHKLDHTQLYPGVAAGLADLVRAGFRMAVLSNKPVRPCREIVNHLGLAAFFGTVYGGDSFATKKPDPEGLRRLLEEAECEPGAAAMIGDSQVDIQTGRAAGVRTFGVTYGFAPASLMRPRPDHSADSFPHLVAALSALGR